MVERPRPTRAEVTDVANAVLDGSDAVMLSSETAMGKFPVEAVQTLSRVIASTESDYPYGQILDRFASRMSSSSEEGISFVACRLSFDMGAKAIIAPVNSMSAALGISRLRPKAPILAMTDSMQLSRQLALVWGVAPLFIQEVADTKQCLAHAKRWLLDRRLADVGDSVVILSSSNPSLGFTDTLQLARLAG